MKDEDDESQEGTSADETESEETFDDEDWADHIDEFFVDQTARDLGCTTMLMWANTIAVLIDTLRYSGMPRDLIHDILDRLDGANEATLSVSGAGMARGFVQAIREGVPGND